ncbi:MAG: hypothetical protein R3B70_46485 [Polyangiaceae bacterium]
MPAVDAANIPYDKAVLVPVVGADFALKIQGTQLAITFIPDETGVMRYSPHARLRRNKAPRPRRPPRPCAGRQRSRRLPRRPSPPARRSPSSS